MAATQSKHIQRQLICDNRKNRCTFLYTKTFLFVCESERHYDTIKLYLHLSTSFVIKSQTNPLGVDMPILHCFCLRSTPPPPLLHYYTMCRRNFNHPLLYDNNIAFVVVKLYYKTPWTIHMHIARAISDVQRAMQENRSFHLHNLWRIYIYSINVSCT